MNPTLLQQLKAAGFPNMNIDGYEPSLDDLIDACGENFGFLNQHVERKLWEAGTKIEKDKPTVKGYGAIPRDAVASMWLAWINSIKP